MDNTRITIALEQSERAALMRLARAELRTPRDQARHLLRTELRRLGLLQSSACEGETDRQEVTRE